MFRRIFLLSLVAVLFIFVLYFLRNDGPENLELENGKNSSTPTLREDSSLGKYFQKETEISPAQAVTPKDEVKTCVIDGQTVEAGQSVSGTTCAP